MARHNTKSIFIGLCLLWPAAIQADEFPPIYNSEPDKSANPMPAWEAAENFQLPPGISASVFAAEPDVQNPIAMAWDSRGRLWIAENYTYAERAQKFDLNLKDRVVILADTDGDGVHDHRSVFADQVQMLTGIAVGHGGAWLMCPPLLLRIPDSNLDGVADGPAEVILDGFDVASENYHNFANGLAWGPDGWLYGRCGGSCPGRVGVPGTPNSQRIPLEGGIWRYHVHQKQFEVLCHGTTNPWGHDWDQWGECFFINTVNGHLWHMIPGAHFHRPFTLDPNPHTYELIDTHADHWHFDTQGEWFQSRDGKANDWGGGHAHVGMMIYLGNQWPAEYRGRLMTWNIHGQRVNQEILHRSGSGFVGKHAQDILLARDPFFRGMELSYGPDGSVMAIDWSDTGECHEHTGVHRTSGRVYRFSATKPITHSALSQSPSESGSQAVATTTDATVGEIASPSGRDLRELSCMELARLHEHSNEWFIRQSRLILAERARPLSPSLGDASQAAPVTSQQSPDLQTAVGWLSEKLQSAEDRLACNSLLTLFAMGKLQQSQLQLAIQHPHEQLRTWAVRFLVDQYPLDSVHSHRAEFDAFPVARLKQLVMMAQSDSSGLVRLALASALQRLPWESRIELAIGLMSRVEDAQDHNLPLLVWYGLIPTAESMPMQLAEAALASTWSKTQRLIARRLASLMDQHPEAADRLIRGALSKHTDEQLNLLRGFAQGLKGWRTARAPAAWPQWLQAMDSLTKQPSHQTTELLEVTRELSLLFGDGRTLEAIRTVVCDPSADISVRRSAFESLVSSTSEDLEEICLPLLEDARLNSIAMQGLSRSNSPEVAKALIQSYYRFRSPERPAVIALLSSRVAWAETLLDAIANGKIPKEHLSAYDLRQMAALEHETLNSRLADFWGFVRNTHESKRQRIDDIKKLLKNHSEFPVNLSMGRQLFDRQCCLCHRLFGSGQSIGPDLTGGNRRDLDYLLENIVDPSAIVSKNYHLSLILTSDGRTLSGLVVSQGEKTLDLQTQTALVTLPISEVEEIRATDLSPMPDGLLENLSDQEIINLIAYLQHPTQVPLPE